MSRGLFPSAIRRNIATSDPVAQAMWAEGASLEAISQALGYGGCINQSAIGVLDPISTQVDIPVPGIPPGAWKPGESDEARVWRRFPINAHKMGS